MKITSIKIKTVEDGIQFADKFKKEIDNLGKTVVLAGANGSGKTRFLKLLEKSANNIQNETKGPWIFKIKIDDKEVLLTKSLAKDIHVVNYSHFDARLQDPSNYSPYIINQAKNKLRQCDYAETALNSLLYLQDLAEGFSNESNASNHYQGFKEFVEYAEEVFDLKIGWDSVNHELTFFGIPISKVKLSPGQIYLLRIAVACKLHDVNGNYIFLVDEPEIHLHPKALVRVIEKLKERFSNSQFFIATHSLPLISYLTVTDETTTVLCIKDGVVVDYLQSNSEPILSGMLGGEETQFAMRQLFLLPQENAANKFCMECFLDAKVLSGGRAGDLSTDAVERELASSEEILIAQGKERIPTVLDFGAGDGRFLECLVKDIATPQIQYYAYDKDDNHLKVCKRVMDELSFCRQCYSDEQELVNALSGKVNYAIMVNVLHEIPPTEWKKTFSTISRLLDDGGRLLIVEREELTVGESPYEEGYLVLTGSADNSELSLAGDCVFGVGNYSFHRGGKSYLICYNVSKEGLQNNFDLNDLLQNLRSTALEHIRKLRKEKSTSMPQLKRYSHGMKLGFWLNQLATSMLFLEDLKDRSSMIMQEIVKTKEGKECLK